MKKRIVVLPGDGIGPEVTAEAVKLCQRLGSYAGFDFEIKEGLIGGASLDQTGLPVTEDVIEMCRKADAVFLGAVGGSKWDGLESDLRPEMGLLKIRKELGLFTNLRPAQVFEALIESSTLRREVIEGVNILVVRELTGGIYFGSPKIMHEIEGEEQGIDTMVYRVSEVERIAHKAFQAAEKRKKKVTSVDKANVLVSSQLWRKNVTKVASSYPDVKLEHMLVDNCAMQLVRNPKQFDVLLTGNMFGDILSDEASMLTGSLGMLPSASLGENTGLYEPAHGSAPDIAGKNMANPLASVASIALMFRYAFKDDYSACIIEQSIQKVLKKGFRTSDIYSAGCQCIGTKEMGCKVIEEIHDHFNPGQSETSGQMFHVGNPCMFGALDENL